MHAQNLKRIWPGNRALTCYLSSYLHPPDPAAPVLDTEPPGPVAGCGAGTRDGAVNILDISVTDGESGPVLILAGEADLTTVAQLNRALDTQIQSCARLVTVDLSGLRFADCATVAALAVASTILKDQGRQLELLHPHPAVARTLELTRADQVLAVRGDPASGHRPAQDPGPAGDGPALPRLRVLLSRSGGDAVLRLAGEIDLNTVSVVAAAVDQCLQDRPLRMTVDLRAMTFCDGAGGRVLRQAQQKATAAGIGFRLTGLTPPVRRLLTLTQAAGLLRAAGEPAGPDEPEAGTPARHGAAALNATPPARRPAPRPGRDTPIDPGAMPPVPPGPAPDAVSAARRQLNEQYANGVFRLLWELDKQPMPDVEAISRAITAIGSGQADSAGPALVLLQAARLGLDRLEARALDAAHTAGISDETLAALLGLPGAAAAAAWHQWLTARRALPYDEPRPAPHAVPAGPADAAARAGHRARQAAARIAYLAKRREQLSSGGGKPRPVNRESAELSAAHAGEARILAAEAAERETLGLLRAAEGLERCAAAYEQLANTDSARRDEYRHQAAWHWHAARDYRQLAEQRNRTDSTGR